MRRQAVRQGPWALVISQNKTLTCGYGGALGGTRTPNLLIRRFLCGRPAPFRSVRDLGLVSPRLSRRVRNIRRLFIRVAPSVAPSRTPRGHR